MDAESLAGAGAFRISINWDAAQLERIPLGPKHLKNRSNRSLMAFKDSNTNTER